MAMGGVRGCSHLKSVSGPGWERECTSITKNGSAFRTVVDPG